MFLERFSFKLFQCSLKVLLGIIDPLPEAFTHVLELLWNLLLQMYVNIILKLRKGIFSLGSKTVQRLETAFIHLMLCSEILTNVSVRCFGVISHDPFNGELLVLDLV